MVLFQLRRIAWVAASLPTIPSARSAAGASPEGDRRQRPREQGGDRKELRVFHMRGPQLRPRKQLNYCCDESSLGRAVSCSCKDCLFGSCSRKDCLFGKANCPFKDCLFELEVRPGKPKLPEREELEEVPELDLEELELNPLESPDEDRLEEEKPDISPDLAPMPAPEECRTLVLMAPSLGTGATVVRLVLALLKPLRDSDALRVA
jgi:hypothetical protein